MATFIISGRDWKHNKQGLEPDYPLICTVTRYTTKLSPLELHKTLDEVVTSVGICIRAEKNIRTARTSHCCGEKALPINQFREERNVCEVSTCGGN